jgi:hypothetical protein
MAARLRKTHQEEVRTNAENQFPASKVDLFRQVGYGQGS